MSGAGAWGTGWVWMMGLISAEGQPGRESSVSEYGETVEKDVQGYGDGSGAEGVARPEEFK